MIRFGFGLLFLFLGSALWAQTPAPPVAAAPAPPASPGPPKPDYPPIETITEGYEKIISTLDGEKSFYTLWRRKKDQQLLAELPKNFATQRHYIALTLASGETYAGLQAGEKYVYWRQYGKRLALVEPNVSIRSTGDKESKSSVERLFTDRVLLDVPILTIIRNGGPVIDLDALLVDQAGKFFDERARGIQKKLLTIKTAKAFPENVEVGIEVPAENGRLRTFHYSISLIKENKAYKPRMADERIGYFTTTFSDFGKFKEGETTVRYINRWHLEKADSSLKKSPPKEPIVFYIEHTTPIRYRRWVRRGVEMWNEAFENVGLINAIEVRQQDQATKAHMEKDPEDVRYNFVRWLNNGIGTAIGPSRVNPNTGQILDADIILTDGWIRYFWTQYDEVLPDIMTEGYSPETLAWLYRHPKWDPRLRLSPPERRQEVLETRAKGVPHLGGHALGAVDHRLLGDQEFDGLAGGLSQKNGLCMAANCKTHGLALRLMLATAEKAEKEEEKKKGEEENDEEEKEDEEDKEQLLDGIPESFIGPLLADLVAHEVGHTIGLRHNFKSSAVYTMEEINSETFRDKKPFAGSVMDYLPVNINVETGEVQGNYAMREIGPYDHWAVEYGYTSASDLTPILSRVAEPELAYATDEDTWGPDPYARRYDFSRDPLTYAQNQMRLVRKNRAVILDQFVEDGESWARARRGYELTLNEQVRAVGMMANWVGGAFVYRDKKGDPNGRAPIEVVPAEKQREALDFVMEHSFRDKAFGLTPDLLRHMTVDKWWDNGGSRGPSIMEDPAWPIHDRVLGIQAAVLTALMKPSTLERVYDNEFLVPEEEDALTLPELLDRLHEGIWGDVLPEQTEGKAYSARSPMISSLRRNLQKEYVDRLIELLGEDTGLSVAEKPVQDLAAMQLERIYEEADAVKELPLLDPYSRAHLMETGKRIQKVLDAAYVRDLSDGGLPFPFFLRQ